MIDVDARAAAPRPWLELDRAPISHIMRADDVESFPAHPAQMGGILFGREFLCQLFRDDGVLGHFLLLPGIRNQSSVISNQTFHLAAGEGICPAFLPGTPGQSHMTSVPQTPGGEAD